MTTRLSALTAAAALIAAGPAFAQAPGSVDADIQCLGVLTFIANNEDAAMRTAGIAGVSYYLGRLEARDIDYAARLESTMRGMTEEQARQTGMRCGNEISAAGDRMRVIGDDMAMRDPPAE